MRELRYHPGLCLGESIQVNKLGRLKRNLNRCPLRTNVCLITLARNGRDLLDIYPSRYLGQRFYDDRLPLIVGIAGDHEEAVGLAVKMLEECMRVRGDCRLREFFSTFASVPGAERGGET